MNLLQSIQELPRTEKVKVMEFIWKELTNEDKDFESPNWHKTELEKTEKRMTDGEEEILDWTDAKQRLRKEFK